MFGVEAKEQADQQRRGHDQKKAEGQEQAIEGRSSRARFKIVPHHRAQREPKVRGPKRRGQLFFEALGQLFQLLRIQLHVGNDPQIGSIAETRGP